MKMSSYHDHWDPKQHYTFVLPAKQGSLVEMSDDSCSCKIHLIKLFLIRDRES